MPVQGTIFENETSQPLAARLRPQTLEEYCGQKHLLGEGRVLRRLIESDSIGSMIFWGPPGVGKTTLARIIANRTKANFIDFSAVTSGIKEIKQVMEQAEKSRRFGEKTILFVDEIHRFQQSAAGRLPPLCRKGKHHPHRRDDGKSLLRGERRASLPLQGVRLAGTEAGGAHGSFSVAPSKTSGASETRK